MAGEWLEKALIDLCNKVDSLDLDRDIISGLVSYCQLAEPLDAKEYLDNIIGQEVGKSVTEEYLRLRGHSNLGSSDVLTSNFHAYVKPASNQGSSSGTKKPFKTQKEAAVSSYKDEPRKVNVSGNQTKPNKNDAFTNQENRGPTETMQKPNQTGSKKKKAGKVVSLADAAKGAIIFQQGKPCSCQARRHNLVSNCLSCGKIVCEQEGEGPCQFCGALVLKEGSTYAGLEGSFAPVTDSEVAAEAFAKRLVDYDRNSAARTTVIDDQSDYYEIEGNSWLSKEEKELLKKKQEEVEEAERVQRNKVVVTFDLVGRKVMLNKDEVSQLESENNRILRPADDRELNRIKPNPTLKLQPVFIDPGRIKEPVKSKQPRKSLPSGLCLEITGRVQHDSNDLRHFVIDNQQATASNGRQRGEDDVECSLDYN